MLKLEQTSEVKFYIRGLKELYSNSAYNSSHGIAVIKWNLVVEQLDNGSVRLSVSVPEQMADITVEVWDENTDVNYDEKFALEIMKDEVLVERSHKELLSNFNIKPYSFVWYKDINKKEFVIE